MTEIILTAEDMPEMTLSAADAAELDLQGVSLKGDKGDKGEPGYSPVKGVDYWTAEDKDEIVTEVNEDIAAELAKKVDKESGKGLSANDYTDEEKAKLAELPQYVKKTDYASDIVAGVVKYYPGLGVVVESDGTIRIDAATNDDIDKKLSYYKPITPARLDYALKPYIAKLKEQSVPHSEVSDYPVTLTDALAGEGFRALKVYGSAAGVGDATASTYKIPVRLRGKNLLPYPYYHGSRTTNGITYTDNGDGTITASGTATGTAYHYQARVSTENMLCEGGKTYTFSWGGVGSGTTYYGFVKVDNAVKAASTGSVTFTPSTTQYIDVGFLVISGATVDNLVFKPQVELGTTATGYEEYKGSSATATLDTQLASGEYIDAINKKRYSSDGTQTDITVEGELKTIESGSITIDCMTEVSPPKIDAEYWQDINKVITEMKNAVLAQGGNV